MLNAKQKKTLLAGAFVFVLMGAIPPWTYTFKFEGTYSEVPAGYALIIDPPSPRVDNGSNGVKLDISRLLVQWFVVGATTGLGIILLADKTT